MTNLIGQNAENSILSKLRHIGEKSMRDISIGFISKIRKKNKFAEKYC